MSRERKEPNYLDFVLGGSAGMMACCFTHPMDVIKNEMQLSSQKRKSSIEAIKIILQHGGLFGFYDGLSAGLLKQATYTTTCLGIYSRLIEAFTGADGTPPGFGMKAVFGMSAGLVGAFVGTPVKMVLIRMKTDRKLPPTARRNYANAVHALSRIVREEGLTTLWRGGVLTMTRAMITNAAQLASYSQAKEFLLTKNREDNLACHFESATISGLVTTVTAMPVDICKTRIQNMKIIGGKPEFTGAIDVLSKIFRNEGIFAMWKGFIPYFTQAGPHVVLTLMFLDELHTSYKTHVLGLPVKK